MSNFGYKRITIFDLAPEEQDSFWKQNLKEICSRCGDSFTGGNVSMDWRYYDCKSCQTVLKIEK